MVKGTSTGTSTDIDGKFSLAAKTGDVLEVSYVGYESKAVKVPESGKLRITLTEISTGLDEVVVVGVSMKKSDLTGAVRSTEMCSLKNLLPLSMTLLRVVCLV